MKSNKNPEIEELGEEVPSGHGVMGGQSSGLMDPSRQNFPAGHLIFWEESGQ